VLYCSVILTFGSFGLKEVLNVALDDGFFDDPYENPYQGFKYFFGAFGIIFSCFTIVSY